MPEQDFQTGRTTKRTPLTTEKNIQILSLIYDISLIRCFIKWIIHVITGTCELQRIIKNNQTGVRTIKIEQSLQRSKLAALRRVIEVEPDDIDAAVKKIMTLKNIVPETNPSFFSSLKTCLEQIYGYDTLFCCVEKSRMEKFDSCNEKHEAMLLRLWDTMQPNEPLKGRISKQWGAIGFQGDDPKTDFRGMGILSLLNLLYFAEQHTDLARQTLQHSHHPQYGYSFAIVGINITSMAYEFMCNGLLRSHFFNKVQGRPNMDNFHQVFCFLMFKFDKFWIQSEPENVMAFGRIRDEFKVTIEALLRYVPSAILDLDD